LAALAALAATTVSAQGGTTLTLTGQARPEVGQFGRALAGGRVLHTVSLGFNAVPINTFETPDSVSLVLTVPPGCVPEGINPSNPQFAVQPVGNTVVLTNRRSGSVFDPNIRLTLTSLVNADLAVGTRLAFTAHAEARFRGGGMLVGDDSQELVVVQGWDASVG
jgi:hypothetical protein